MINSCGGRWIAQDCVLSLGFMDRRGRWINFLLRRCSASSTTVEQAGINASTLLLRSRSWILCIRRILDPRGSDLLYYRSLKHTPRRHFCFLVDFCLFIVLKWIIKLRALNSHKGTGREEGTSPEGKARMKDPRWLQALHAHLTFWKNIFSQMAWLGSELQPHFILLLSIKIIQKALDRTLQSIAGSRFVIESFGVFYDRKLRS